MSAVMTTSISYDNCPQVPYIIGLKVRKLNQRYIYLSYSIYLIIRHSREVINYYLHDVQDYNAAKAGDCRQMPLYIITQKLKSKLNKTIIDKIHSQILKLYNECICFRRCLERHLIGNFDQLGHQWLKHPDVFCYKTR